MAYKSNNKRRNPWIKPTTPFGQRVQDKRYNTTLWRKMRLAWLKRNPACVVCGYPANVLDHITPVRLGGDFWKGPFQSMCTSCHNAKSAREQKQQTAGGHT